MKEKVMVFSIACLLMAGILCGCGKEENEKTVIPLGSMQDILSWNEAVIWNTESDILLKTGEEEEKSIFQDPFYEREEGEEIVLQYISEDQLYYIRTLESQYYELCCMNLNTYENIVLYTNYSEIERTYHYLGIQKETVTAGDQGTDAISEVVQQFCKIGDKMYLLVNDTLYQMDLLTKYRKKMIENLDPDTELVFWNSKIYYKDENKFLMEYDRERKTKVCLSDWMVQKLCYCGKGLLVQRMNRDIYCYKNGELEKMPDAYGNLIWGDENYFYCSEGNGTKLVVYDADTWERKKEIDGENIWGAVKIEDVIYYLEAAGDHLVLGLQEYDTCS